MSATVQGGGQPPDPPVGLLSRTVFPSPIVERILTGRIRHSRYVDAIFVSRGSVVVKERGHDGQFSNIAFTSNFGSPVVAADIVGKRVRRPRDADVDHPKVKLEALDLKMDQCALQPSHKLVLLLEAGELLFLTMTRDGTHAWTFDHVRQSLPPAADALQDWRFLAVHPDSHAMAVSSWSGHVAVLTFSDSLQIRSTLYFDSGITILLMDFLYSSADDSTVYLMLVGRKDDRFRILVYSWDPQQPLTPVLPYRYNLDWRHPIPNLLIPLANTPGGFVLGALQQLSLYSNAHVGSIQKSVEYTDVPVFTPEPSQNPESSFEHPLWTNWARASRWFTNSDCLYLIREDGVVYNVEVGTELESVKNYNGHVLEGLDFVRSGQPTCLRGNIASAFALYQPEEDNDDGPDVLLFAGDLSDGAHYEIGQTQPHAGDDPMIIVLAPQQKEIFYNWAPFLDVAVVPPQRRSREISRHAYKSRPEDHLNDRSRVFATSGKGSWGAVCELRMGREFIVDSTLELEDMLKGANTAWSIHNTSADWRFDFVSTPFQTVVINWLRQEIEPQQLCDTPTLAVGLLKPFGKTDFIREFILQVTTSSITLLKVQLRLEDEGEPLHTLCVVQSWQQTSVLAAMDVSTGLIVLATRRGDDMFLSLKQIQHIDDDDWQLSQLGESLLCNHDPTCISIFSFPAHSAVIKQEEGVPASQPLQFVAFGTNVGEIAISRIDSIGLGPLKYYILCGETASEMASETACESLCVVSNPESPDCQLICGLRNGALIIGRLLIEDTVARLDLGSTTNFYMGSTSPSLKITADSHGLGCFVYGGVDTCYLDFGHGRTEGMTLSNVWITNRADRSLNQPPMGAICLINDQTGQSDQPSRVLCLSIHGRGYFGVLGKAVEPLPRRIPVSGTPNRLIYSSFLQCLIVASTVVINDNATHTRFETSRITLVDPNGEAQDADSMDIDGDNAPSNSTYRELPDVSERITSLAEWMCTKGDSKHHFLVVGTTAETKEGVYGGVIRLFQVRSNDNGDREIRSLKSSKESKPVGAVCALDDRTLLYSAGDEIRKRTLTFESDIELKKSRLFQLASSVVYLDCRYTGNRDTSFVCASLSDGSTRILRFNEDFTLLEHFACESEASYGLSHIALWPTSTLLSSSKDQVVTGIHIPVPGHSSIRHSSPSLFEAELTASITRFAYECIRPPWKQLSDARSPESNKDIIGVATDGSLTSFQFLSEHVWRLLRFIANMASRDTRLCRRGPWRDGALVCNHIEPQTTDSRQHHVDGDILAQLIARSDAHAMLNEMLSAQPMQALLGEKADFETAEARRERFGVLVEQALTNLGELEGLDVEAEVASADSDSVTWALRYTRRLLELPF